METIKIWAAFSPSGLFKIVRNTEGDCWAALCELQSANIANLKKRGYKIVCGTFERDSDNVRLRKIAAFVPARIYIEASERAGYPTAVKAN